MGGPPEADYSSLLLAGTPFVSLRSQRDKLWGWALLTLYIGCAAFSVYGWKHSNPTFFKLNKEYLNDPTHCPLPDATGRRLLEAVEGAHQEFSLPEFWSHAAGWLTTSVVLSLGLAAGFLYLVQHHTAGLARATIGFQLAVPTAAALGLLFSGNVLQAVCMGGLAAITYWVFYLWRQEIASATQLLSVAGHGLASNTALIGLTIALNIAALLLALPQLIGVAIAFSNGTVVPNPARGGNQQCVDQFGDGLPCCAWQTDSWVPFYMAACALAATWTMLTAQQVRVFVVSGTVAQWYFSTAGSPTTGNLMRSVKHALGPSFGTNAFAGLVITITSALRQQADREQREGSLAGFLMSCLLSCIASITEYLTKFATVFAAITGDSLVVAGRKVTDLLARNVLDAFATTIFFPSMVVSLASFTLSALWGGAVWGAYRSTHLSEANGLNAIVLGVLVGGVTLFVLSFLAGVLLSVLDATFICFALDRDRHAISNAELYQGLLGVAEARGMPVEPPSGGVAVGQPAPYVAPPTERA